MLNLLSVLQQLSVKITLDKVNTALRKNQISSVSIVFLDPSFELF